MYICICKQITDKQIKTAIDDGARSVRDLRSELGVASQCGQCGRCAKAILKDHASNAAARSPLPEQTHSPTPADVFPLFGEAILASN